MSDLFSAADLCKLFAAGRIAITLPLPSPQKPPLRLTWYPINPTPPEEVDSQDLPPQVICLPPPPSPVPEKAPSPIPSPVSSPQKSPSATVNPPQSPDSFDLLMDEALAVMSEIRKGKEPMEETAPETSSAATPKSKRKRAKEASPLSPPPKKSTGLRRSSRRSFSSPSVEVLDMSERAVVKEVVFQTEWLQKERLGKFQSLLEFQGWVDVFEMTEVDESMVKEFYSSLTVKTEKVKLVATALVNGTVISFSSKELALYLGVSHDGYGDYTGKHWPEGVDGAAVLRGICRDPSADKIFTTNRMDLSVRLLHTFMVKNVLPRSEKGSTVQHQEGILMDMILRQEKVSLAKIIMGHMAHIRSQPKHGLGYPSIIKRILTSNGVYTPRSKEVPCSRLMDVRTIKKMGFSFDPKDGWVREFSEHEPVPASLQEVLEKLDSLLAITQRHSNQLAEIAQILRSSAPSAP